MSNLQRAKKCVTHHHACDCREYKFNEMESALKVIATWASCSNMDRKPHAKQMLDIELKAMAALNALNGIDA